jgi:hypothetical protein
VETTELSAARALGLNVDVGAWVRLKPRPPHAENPRVKADLFDKNLAHEKTRTKARNTLTRVDLVVVARASAIVPIPRRICRQP